MRVLMWHVCVCVCVCVCVTLMQGRYLRCGDSLPVGDAPSDNTAAAPITLPATLLPAGPSMRGPDGAAVWEVGALPGPHADPDFITSEFMSVSVWVCYLSL